jgi:ATP-dependent 26S proteasome regulatory subunit
VLPFLLPSPQRRCNHCNVALPCCRPTSQVDELRGTPLSVGTLDEMIDESHAIVSSAGEWQLAGLEPW